jgi:DNA-binding NarL/FixJ family response regulator
MAGKKGILICDEHPLFREGIKSAVARAGTFEVLGEAGTGLEAVRLAVVLKPDLLLIGIALQQQSAIRLAGELKKCVPEAALLILSISSETNLIASSFAAGAAGYLLKDSAAETLIQALEVVSQGGHFLDGPISAETVHRIKSLNGSNPNEGLSKYESLTRRQREVMNLLVQGLSYRAIGDKLCISPRTVEGHRNEIMRVMEFTNTVELTRYALRTGLVCRDGDGA